MNQKEFCCFLLIVKPHIRLFQGSVYINGDTKIITSDYECSNGVIHFIDKVLKPYDVTTETAITNSVRVRIQPNVPTSIIVRFQNDMLICVCVCVFQLNFTAAAEVFGYTTFSRLIQVRRASSSHPESEYTVPEIN